MSTGFYTPIRTSRFGHIHSIRTLGSSIAAIVGVVVALTSCGGRSVREERAGASKGGSGTGSGGSENGNGGGGAGPGGSGNGNGGSGANAGATQEVCMGDTPFRVDIDATTNGVSYRLCPGVYATAPSSDPDAALGWTAWSYLSSCGEGPCECDQGWFYTYVADVAGDRARAINALPRDWGYLCETAALAFHRHARAGTFTVARETDVTFRTQDEILGDNAGGMTLRVARSPIVPLSLDGLVAHWTFDRTWEAQSPTAPSWTAMRANFTLGRIGDAVGFEGWLDSYATGPTGDGGCEHPLDIEALPLSVAAWVRLTSSAKGDPRALFATESGPLYAGAWVRFESPGEWWEPVRIAAGFGSGGGDSASQRMLRADGELELDEWHHVAVTFRDRDDIRIYVNGARVAASQYDGGATELGHGEPRGCPVIGHWEGPDGAFGFPGYIDELYVFSRALSDAEVEAIYHL